MNPPLIFVVMFTSFTQHCLAIQCNWMHYTDARGAQTKGSFPPRVLMSHPALEFPGSTTGDGLPLERMAVSGSSVVYIGGVTGVPHATNGYHALYRAHITSLEPLSRNYWDYYGDSLELFRLPHDYHLENMYLSHSLSVQNHHIAFDTTEPRHLSTHSDRVVWVESEVSSGVSKILLHSLEAGKTEVIQSADVTGRESDEVIVDVRAFNNWLYVITNNSSADHGSNSLFLGDLTSGVFAKLADGVINSPLLQPYMLETSSGQNALVFATVDPGTLDGIALEIRTIPQRYKSTLLTSTWTTDSTITGDLLDVLVGFKVAFQSLFVVVSNRDGSEFVLRSCKVSSLHLNDVRCQTIPGSESQLPLAIHTVDEVNMQALYTQFNASSGEAAWWMASISQKHSFVCELTELPESTQDAFITNHLILWVNRDSLGDEWALMLLDIDKDNDGVVDAVDEFPLDGRWSADADNDGIGDESDFIHYSGSCADSATGTACPSDDTILYAVWGSLVALMIGSIVAWHVLRHRWTALLGAYSNDSDTSAAEGLQTALLRLVLAAEIAQLMVVLFTVISVVLALMPHYNIGGLSQKTTSAITWADFAITSCFALDIITRYLTRDIREIPGLWQYLRLNWHDIPSLVTDIPGISTANTVGLGRVLVVTRFARGIRFIRLLKMFRIIRFYRRVTSQNVFLALMVKRPFVFLISFMCFIVILSSVLIKIFEQNQQPEFANLASVLWFCGVTVTTVGYGDMVPTHPISRILTMLLMLCGIGLISTLSANTVVNIISVGNTERKIDEMKRSVLQRWDSFKSGVVQLSAPFNPILVTFQQEIASHPTGHSDLLAETVEGHRSDLLNMAFGVNKEEKVRVPVDELMSGTGGKFQVNNLSSQAELIVKWRKDRMEELVVDLATQCSNASQHSADSGSQPPETRNPLNPETHLRFVLRFFGLDQTRSRGGVGNFEEFLQELSNTMFETGRSGSLALSEVFSYEGQCVPPSSGDSVTEVSGPGQERLRDPLDLRLERVEEILLCYGIGTRVDVHELKANLHILLLMQDRVDSVKWAGEHLQYRSSVRDAVRPPIKPSKPPLANLPHNSSSTINPLLECCGTENVSNR